jgi:hypothetical protein
MNGTGPFMLLRARVHEDHRERFVRWFRAVHSHDVSKIPGMTTVRCGRTAGGTQLGIYHFDSSEVVQTALASPEAAYARGTWEQWAPHLDELTIEIWAELGPLGLYHPAS